MEEEAQFLTASKVIFSVFVAGALVVLLGRLNRVLFVEPRRIRSKLQRQGIKGPSPVFLFGNISEIKRIQLQSPSKLPLPLEAATPEAVKKLSHAWAASVFPHILHGQNEYGPIFMYSTGNIQILCILDPEMVKEVSLCNSLNLGKPSYLATERGPLLGQGILTSNGPSWAHQRKIIVPEFYLDKVKVMINLMVESTFKIIQSWQSKTENLAGDVEIRVDEDMRSLSADIISRACFGSSYSQGEQIFLMLHALQKIMSKGNIGVPGQRHVPSKHNRHIWRLQDEIDTMILKVVNMRREAIHEKDLLQLILDAAKDDGNKGDLPKDITPNRFIIDNCKNIYFSGHETTAISASWCLMLLAAYPEWQARVRAEVLEICGNETPDADKLRSMKTVLEM